MPEVKASYVEQSVRIIIIRGPCQNLSVQSFSLQFVTRFRITLVLPVCKQNEMINAPIR